MREHIFLTTATGTSSPLILHTFFPKTSRVREIKSSSTLSTSNSRLINSIWFSDKLLKIASTFILLAPSRISDLSALPPKTKPNESSIMLLPAPVSPLITFRFLSNSSVAESISATFSIFNVCNIHPHYIRTKLLFFKFFANRFINFIC